MRKILKICRVFKEIIKEYTKEVCGMAVVECMKRNAWENGTVRRAAEEKNVTCLKKKR